VKRGDVVIILMQGDGGKPRPGIIVQSDRLNEAATSLLVCPLSSDIRKPGILRPIIEPTDANGLRLQSQVMIDKLSALSRDRIRQIIGTLDGDAMERIDQALLLVLGLAH